MNCNVCGATSYKVFDAEILGKYHTSYYHCPNCGFLQTDDPVWYQEALHEAINLSDSGILSRNIYYSQQTAVILYCLFKRDARFVDYAGGYGLLTRLMRDLGFNFYWHDPFADNIFARGFEYNSKVGEIELVTSFESLEHFLHPLEEIKKMLAISPNILFSTELLPQPLPHPEDWWYFGLDHGQHISFYSLKTLKHIAEVNNLNFYSNGTNLHLYTNKKLNNNLFNFLLYSYRYGLFAFVKKKMRSLVAADSAYIKFSKSPRDKA